MFDFKGETIPVNDNWRVYSIDVCTLPYRIVPWMAAGTISINQDTAPSFLTILKLLTSKR